MRKICVVRYTDGLYSRWILTEDRRAVTQSVRATFKSDLNLCALAGSLEVKPVYRILIIAVVAAALPASANAKPASGGFRVATVVPEFCQLSASDLAVSEESGILHGQVLEMCNGSSGYRIVAQHRELDQRENVAFEFAGVQKPLQADGWSEIATRAGARFGLRDVNMRYDSLRAPLAITLTITAI